MNSHAQEKEEPVKDVKINSRLENVESPEPIGEEFSFNAESNNSIKNSPDVDPYN